MPIVAHDLHGAQAAPIPEPALQGAGEPFQQRQVFADHGLDIRADDFDHHLPPRAGSRRVDLGDGGRGHGFSIEARKALVDALAEGLLNQRDGLLGSERRHLILKFREFIGDIHRQEVAPRREHLSELYEHRPQVFQRPAQALSPRSANGAAAPRVEAQGAAQRAMADPLGEQFVQAIAADNAADLQEASRARHQPACKRSRRWRARAIRCSSLSLRSSSPCTSL